MVTRNSLPQNYVLKPVAVLNDMASAAGWNLSDATLVRDTTNGGLKFSNAAIDSFSTMEKVNMSLDFSDADFIDIPLFVENASTFGGITIYMHTVHYSKYFQVGVPTAKIRQGYNQLRIYKNEFSNTGSSSWLNPIVTIKIALSPLSGSTTNINILSIGKGYKGVPKGSFILDDGRKEVITLAYPIFEAAGYKANCALVPSIHSGTSQTSMHKSDTDFLYDKKWDMLSHADHSYLTQNADNGLSALTNTKNYLQNLGYTRGNDVLIYPYGDTNDAVIEVAKSLGYKFGRLASANITQSTNGLRITNSYPFEDPMRLVTISIDGYTLTQIKSHIDRAITRGEAIIFMGHYDFTNLQAIVDYCKQVNLDIVTMSALSNGLTNPRLSVNRN
jgi:peptidoglycan/xylan/chitin deacetylase (PgdA/CDA1 family)